MEEMRSADLLLLGSTLLVCTAPTLPEYTLEHGGRLANANDMATHLDPAADYSYYLFCQNATSSASSCLSSCEQT